MNYELFQITLAEELRKLIGKEDKVEIQQIRKNNGVMHAAVSILRGKENVSPVLYLEGYYQRYRQGVPVSHLAKLVFEQYRENRKTDTLNFEFFRDFDKVRDRIFCRIINYARNQTSLLEMPHKKIMDLAIVCYYSVDERIIQDASVQITDQHLQQWKISKEELFHTALKNTEKETELYLVNMSDMLAELLTEGEKEEIEDFSGTHAVPVPMYVMSNKRKTLGAICSFIPVFLQKAAEVLKDDFYVLPSSIHECILIPAREAFQASELQKMVENINNTQVEPQEVLSDCVYYYDSSSGVLKQGT